MEKETADEKLERVRKHLVDRIEYLDGFHRLSSKFYMDGLKYDNRIKQEIGRKDMDRLRSQMEQLRQVLNIVNE